MRDWAHDGDDRRIVPVLRKFAEYCQPRKNVPFERYKFNKRTQESGESYEQFKTTLRKLSEACEFDTITPNEILRDKLIFGIHDTKVRERLLRDNNLTLIKTDEICLAAESMTEQMRIVGQSNNATTSVHAVRQFSGQKNARVKRRHARLKVRQRKSVGTAVANMADSRRSSARLSGNHVTVAANKINSQKSVDRNGQATREIR